jgi:hypothetical protein
MLKTIIVVLLILGFLGASGRRVCLPIFSGNLVHILVIVLIQVVHREYAHCQNGRHHLLQILQEPYPRISKKPPG